MNKFVLYCKSYRNDVMRVKRLAESVEKFNIDLIPFYVSVPSSDMQMFAEMLEGNAITLISDEEIIRANPSLIQEKIDALSGWKAQQIVKSEFWRLGISENYLCLDSDSVFLRPFQQSDFISPDGHPYTVIHEAKELLQFAINHGMEKVCDDFHKEHAEIMEIFGRKGRQYEFGPTPLIWSRAVWEELDDKFLKPRGMNFYDAIMLFPGEMQWYGEAMLKYLPYPLMPVEPLFKVYHYERQYVFGKQQGESYERIAREYLGVCYQSNWEKKMDLVAKPLLSRVARWIRRTVFRRYR